MIFKQGGCQHVIYYIYLNGILLLNTNFHEFFYHNNINKTTKVYCLVMQQNQVFQVGLFI